MCRGISSFEHFNMQNLVAVPFFPLIILKEFFLSIRTAVVSMQTRKGVNPGCKVPHVGTRARSG